MGTRRVEWSKVCLYHDLIKAAKDLHAEADHHVARMRHSLLNYASLTARVADMLAEGRYSIDTGHAWLEAAKHELWRAQL